MDVLEGNKLIARYIGWDFVKLPINKNYPTQQWISGIKKGSNEWDSKLCIDIEDPNFDKKCEDTIESMWNSLCNPNYGRCGQFHSEYKYIMPLVELIENDGYDVDILHKSCFVTKKSNKAYTFSGVSETKIIAIWIAITSMLQVLEINAHLKK